MLFLLSLNCFYNFFGSGSFFRKPFGRKTYRLVKNDTPVACTINVYDCNDSGQYYKTRITIVIDDLC